MDHGNYPHELGVIKQELQQLKQGWWKRCVQRQHTRNKEVLRSSMGDTYVVRGDQNQMNAIRELQRVVAAALLDASTTLPVQVETLHDKLLIGSGVDRYQELLQAVHHPDARRVVFRLSEPDASCLTCEAVLHNGADVMFITALDRQKLSEFTGAMDPQGGASADGFGSGDNPAAAAAALVAMAMPPVPGLGGQDAAAAAAEDEPRAKKQRTEGPKWEAGEALLELLDKPTAKEAERLEQFKNKSGVSIREHCQHLTKEECRAANQSEAACHRVHFKRIILAHTDVSLGNCPFLDTCRNVRGCRYVHYERDDVPDGGASAPAHVAVLTPRSAVPKYLQALPEPQWIRCDIRTFDMSVLGKFGVIMSDPPWEINQELPYGTMADDEMRAMGMGCLQDDGVIFLWVTTRSLELGRECLELWGYDRCDELVWIKTNQLQRLTGRTGRTGHWLNHSKEHCLVGIKGKPNLNRHVDCDVVMAEVRETSRKPDEMYALLERLSPGTRKLEVFARPHNLRPGWIGLGNQLDGVNIKDPELLERYQATYGALPPR